MAVLCLLRLLIERKIHMIQIYNRKNISLFAVNTKVALTPSISCNISDESIFFHQRIFDTYISFHFKSMDSMHLINKLTIGINETELYLFFCKILGENNGKEYINMLIRTGIIE